MFIYILESERERKREKRGDYKAATATASSQEKEEGATETNKQTNKLVATNQHHITNLHEDVMYIHV